MFVRRAIVSSALLLATVALVGLPSAARSGQVAEGYSVDPVHSSAVFRIKHLNISYFYGRFNDVNGTVSFDAANPQSSTMEVEIKTDSVDTHNDKRNGHLKSPDFFNAAKFPTMSFKSKTFAKSGESAFDVTGDLTMHGVTKPLTVKLEKTGAGSTPMGERIGFETTFTVKRSDFGITFMPDGLGEEVRVTVSLESAKK